MGDDCHASLWDPNQPASSVTAGRHHANKTRTQQTTQKSKTARAIARTACDDDPHLILKHMFASSSFSRDSESLLGAREREHLRPVLRDRDRCPRPIQPRNATVSQHLISSEWVTHIKFRSRFTLNSGLLANELLMGAKTTDTRIVGNRENQVSAVDKQLISIRRVVSVV